ncbi:proteoglycan 4 isoform X2 [Macrosteles quadrilineatus]|uniref:proteoglycan 4 isoform X2 n=1 Tax=Macrosteles quadrilineatus TaxID=74068 RepID=UPI0023E240FD|nr:proteoglycan 4 isoform X2 [Macrosteles quadrilineatus]
MKILNIFIHAVVLWTLVECRNVGRFKRSLDVEDKGSNLTQKQNLGAIHSEGLQHFTSPPPPTPGHSTPSLTKDLPFLPEDINIQSLKNDDHLRVSYNRKISIAKENSDADSSQEQKKLQKSNTNDEIYFKFNKTGVSSSTASELVISHTSYDHSSSSVVYDEENSDEQTEAISSTSETSKVDSERKNLEIKKKEKGKKEILDSVTVPTDSVGAGKLEKPFKDSLLNSKLKDKKDSTSEALDDRRSTTSRISSSSNISLSEHDNNKLSSLDLLKVNPPSNNKEAANQSVNSVINVNGVNNDLLKKPKVKTPLKKVLDDGSSGEVHNAAASSTQVVEVAGKKMASTTNQDIFSTATPAASILPNSEIPTDQKLNPTTRRFQLEDSTSSKVDLLPKVTSSSMSTVIKPSIAFKQQLANKLKGFEPVPTAPMAPIEETDEVQSKIGGKSSSKFILRKKPTPLKLDHAPLLEINIPPTATAWTLASLKSSTEPLRSSQKPESAPELPPLVDATPQSQLTTLTPVSRVRSFVPWSTRLLRSRSTKPPATLPVEVEKETTMSKPDPTTSSQVNSSNASPSFDTKAQSSTEEQSIIRTTTELDRNHSETSINIIQAITDDVMIKDQSSARPQHVVKAETKAPVIETSETDKETPAVQSVNDNESQVVENVIESKQLLEENESQNKKEEKNLEKLEESGLHNTKVLENEAHQDIVNENVNEVKSKESDGKKQENVLLTSKNSSVTNIDTKAKNVSEHLDTAVEMENPDDNKSGEDSEEEEHQNQTTTLPPIFEPFETTTVMDLDEDVDENDRDEDEFPSLMNKTVVLKTATTNKPNETNSSPSSNTGSSDSNGTYITSIDIISKDNKVHTVTSKPSEGDINWYNVETKVNNESVEETSEKPSPVEVTTNVPETTNEPETTKLTELQTTELPDNSSDTVTTMMPSTTTVPPQSSTVSETEFVDKDTEFDRVEDPSSCVRVIVHMSPMRLCRQQQQLRESIAAQLTPHIVSWDQVLILKPQECDSGDISDREQDLSVHVCFTGQDELPSPAIRNEFLKRFSETIADPNFPVIVRKRQGRFNYGQRCTPVSLDDYSLDNISVYNSVRRKGALRASKRSYGNPGFDDPGAPTHSINFAGLANFSSDRRALDEEFNQIPMITVKPDELPPGAESKNRYANVIPLPETRVMLQTKEGADHLDDYINANYIKGPKGQEKLYIACQAPLQSTIEDFWRMVWQQQTKVILMLTALNENGVEKCADYLPQLEITDCHRMFGDFQVTLKKHEVREKYIISSLQLKNLETNLWREVTHLWYVSWPAQGVPDDCSSMIAFLIEARSYMRGAQGPTVVHCSPGTGRTGTVIAIDLCIRDFETLRSVDIPKTVYALRRDRAGCVQTKDQYSFIYQVLNLYATKLTGGALDSI